MSWFCVLLLCGTLSLYPFMWTWHDSTLTLCTYSIKTLTVINIPLMQMLILLDLVLNATLQGMSSWAKWSMTV